MVLPFDSRIGYLKWELYSFFLTVLPLYHSDPSLTVFPGPLTTHCVTSTTFNIRLS